GDRRARGIFGHAERRQLFVGRNPSAGGRGVGGFGPERRARAELSQDGRQDGLAASDQRWHAGGERRRPGGARSMARLTALFVLAIGCGGSPVVTRIVGAETLRGSFVDGDAYAAFFRGAAAEEEGKWTEAIAAYEEARSF